MNNIRRPYIAVQITLTTKNVAYDIWQLVNTILQAEGAGSASEQAPGNCRCLVLQADPTNTDTVLIGDALLSSTRYGYALPKALDVTAGTSQGNGIKYESNLNNVTVSGRHAMCVATDAQKLNVEIEAA